MRSRSCIGRWYLMRPAVLALEDGSLYHGRAIGADGTTVGEVVFNTAMTGYQEILTDPSYARQLVTLTYPHIGNTGCTDQDNESRQPFAAGLIIRDLPLVASNWRSQTNLESFLREQGVVAISEVDTRALTRKLRDVGALNGCIMAGDDCNADAAIEKAKAFPGLKGMDLAKVVSVDQPYSFDAGTWDLEQAGFKDAVESKFHVVAYDFGVKRNILRMLVDRGCKVTVVPAQTSANEVLMLEPDGVFLSNGPGDPEPCTYAINAIQAILRAGVPIFGICLGHQLLGLASGAQSVKMKFGHHGANHPVIDLASRRVMISSQNHGFAVDESSLPDNVRATHRSLFDDSLQGIERTDVPAYSFQGHPEASPGPHDVAPLFDRFVHMMTQR